MMLEEHSILLTSALALMNGIGNCGIDYQKLQLDEMEELSFLASLCKGRDVSAAVAFLHAEFSKLMSFSGLLVEYQHFIHHKQELLPFLTSKKL